MFERVLVANRGEIAVRITRTLHRLGIEAVAVHSEADAGALHVRVADRAVPIGPAPARDSYLAVDRIIDAALASGAEAVHPGYGFLSENPALAEACVAAGLVIVGPPAAAIAAMGDKVRAKALVAAAGVAVVPGSVERDLDDDALAAEAHRIGFPVLVKPSAGGGGKGMRVVAGADEVADQIAAARREARAAFGDDTLLVERFLATPRHLEIQVLADTHGQVVHLGERECSLQRRHQKIVEEAPSPLVDDRARAAMGAAAVAAARACGYTGAGTVEFIVSADRPDEFFFMEMNTRLQVEHPVTEAVLGLDLVEWQLRVAAGEPLAPGLGELVPRGHAIEARVYAEDPSAGFLPTGGTVLALHEPTDHPGVRVDSGLAVGTVVGSDYDPMVAKVVAHGTDRDDARRRLDAALADTAVLGLTTNVGFLRDLLAHPDVVAGRLDTGLVDRLATGQGDGDSSTQAPSWVVALVALWWLTGGTDPHHPWDRRDGWTVAGGRTTTITVETGGTTHEVAVGPGAGADRSVAVGDGPSMAVSLSPLARSADDPEGASVVVDGRRRTVRRAVAPDGTWWLAHGGRTWAARVEEPWEAHPGDRHLGHQGPVLAPMPGTVTEVLVAAGDQVHHGEALAVVEAMKMEFTLRAPFDGVVSAVHASAGHRVALGDAVVTVDDQADDDATDGDEPRPR
ncbi:acetyl/propionyl/methylcrotonyl-CoA carboxylase subunit alpha [Rhabdothermincola salaria]|uniref:acetyl/propionyl/methylcrotonyl-CoA carboxylase subunit alpha n=1 Tax=Rhabdothermincola salaria TaxID=2903142 RepID=UPI001E2A8BA3|nr:hypothetical protein [Rhabdothermincola salaria]